LSEISVRNGMRSAAEAGFAAPLSRGHNHAGNHNTLLKAIHDVLLLMVITDVLRTMVFGP